MNIVLGLILISLASCSHLGFKKPAFTINLNSNVKNASISIYQVSSKSFIDIGETPLSISESLLLEKNIKESFVILKISKRGYVSESIILERNANAKIDFFSNLTEVHAWNDPEKEFSSENATNLILKTQEINLNIVKKNYDQAIKDVDMMLQEFPRSYILHDMKGSILYLSGEVKQASMVYEKSLGLNPENARAKTMIEKIQKGLR